MNYKGTIIEESLEEKGVLKDVTIISTKVEKITSHHKTPWLRQWTLHLVEIPQEKAKEVAEKLSKSLDYSHHSSWYADYKNDKFHYIIFKEKIFKINRRSAVEYEEAKKYGISLGIPEYQVDFSPEVT